jgi:serine/threonine protein kinase
MRVSNVNRESIENEARVVSSLLKNGGHELITRVFRHGWLKGLGGMYFIDMQLADFTLQQYISRHKDKGAISGNIITNFPDLEWYSISTPDFLDMNRSVKGRILDMLLISDQIAEALTFLHIHYFVHRDLKPSNGNPIRPSC